MKANKRLWGGLTALAAASLACSVSTSGGPDVAATVNALSTSVQQTLDAQTAAPPGTATPTPAPALTPISALTPTLGATIAPASPVPTGELARPNGVVIHAQHLAAAPQIDGNPSDWNGLPYTVDQVVYQPGNWFGPADQSAAFAIGWDTDNLYLAAHVVDDVHVQTQLGEQIFKGDSLELLLDGDLRGDYADPKLSADDFQLGLTPGEQKIGGPDAYLWYPKAKAGRPAAVTVAAYQDETGNGYYLEAALRWSVFGLAPAAGDRFGFALSSSDNDTPGTAEQQSMISTASTRQFTDPTTWGTLVLDK